MRWLLAVMLVVLVGSGVYGVLSHRAGTSATAPVIAPTDTPAPTAHPPLPVAAEAATPTVALPAVPTEDPTVLQQSLALAGQLKTACGLASPSRMTDQQLSTALSGFYQAIAETTHAQGTVLYQSVNEYTAAVIAAVKDNRMTCQDAFAYFRYGIMTGGQ